MAKTRRHSLATRKLMSLKARGKNNPFYGKSHSKAALRKMSLRMRGKNNPMYGKTHTEAVKRKLRAIRMAVLKAKKR